MKNPTTTTQVQQTTMTTLRIKRILLPLNAQRPSDGLLEQAATMAARLQSELCGLFIEDNDLLNFAQLPVGREISFDTGRIQPSSITSMERSLRQIANRTQQELSRLANHYKIQSQFVTRRGYTQQTLQAELQIGDLLILSGIGSQANKTLLQQAYEYLHSDHHYLAWLPAGSAAIDGITVVQDSSSAADESMQLANLLATGSGHELSIQSYSTIDSLSDKLQRCKQGLWIVPYHPDWDIKVLEKLLANSRCPVLIVNT